jgi:hypothetical protein
VSLELGFNGIFLGLNGIDFFRIFWIRFKIPIILKNQSHLILSTGQKRGRANGNTEDTDFTNLRGFFGMFHL